MRAAGNVTVSRGEIPSDLAVCISRPQVRLDSQIGIKAAAMRILRASNVMPEVFEGRDRRRDSVQRADALTIAFARELEDIIKEVFEVEYPELRAREFMPERFVSPEALTFTYRMTNRVGAADIIDDNGNNIPKVDVTGEEWQQPIVNVGASYDFTILDQMRSGRLGISIDALKAEAARWAVEYKIEQLAANGDASQGLVGLWNAPGIVATPQSSLPGQLAGTVSVTNGSAAITFSVAQTLPAGQILTFGNQTTFSYALAGAITAGTAGTLSSPFTGVTNGATTAFAGGLTWLAQIDSIGSATTSNATPPAVVVAQLISSDIAAMIAQIYANTQGIHVPDTMLVPASIYQKLKTTPRSPGYTSDTLLTYLEDLYDLDIEMWPQLNSADTAGHNGVHGLVVVYKKDPKILNLMQALAFTQLPPQQIRMAWEINTWARTGAAQVRYPLAVTYMQGLG